MNTRKLVCVCTPHSMWHVYRHTPTIHPYTCAYTSVYTHVYIWVLVSQCVSIHHTPCVYTGTLWLYTLMHMNTRKPVRDNTQCVSIHTKRRVSRISRNECKSVCVPLYTRCVSIHKTSACLCTRKSVCVSYVPMNTSQSGCISAQGVLCIDTH